MFELPIQVVSQSIVRTLPKSEGFTTMYRYADSELFKKPTDCLKDFLLKTPKEKNEFKKSHDSLEVEEIFIANHTLEYNNSSFVRGDIVKSRYYSAFCFTINGWKKL